MQEIVPTSFEDLATETQSFSGGVGPKVVVRELSLSEGFTTIISQMEDSDFDAQPTNQSQSEKGGHHLRYRAKETERWVFPRAGRPTGC